MERLTVHEGRVVASLVEKHLTIPQHYPLTLHALVAACNQTSNREPVTFLSESEVLGAVESLKAKRMVRAVLPSHGRSVVRYRHVLDETLGLDAPQLAVLAVLQLRGPQTVAELRARTERMAAIDSVDHELGLLAQRDEPIVVLVGRRPGQKEDRWASLLAEEGPREDWAPAGPGAPAAAAADAAPGLRSTAPPVDALRADVGDLRREVDAVRAELEAMRDALGVLRSGLEDLRTSLGG
jgi:uncharacterized protein YceH (UPF0502 family)